MRLGTQQQYNDAPWMQIAESYLGVREVRGDENPVILKFFREAGHPEIKEDEVAWCSAFVNAVLYEAGLRGTQNLMAKSFLRWDGGDKVTQPRFGDIAVFNRGKPNSGLGHVTFVVKADANTVTCLGGNQGQVGEVNVDIASRARLVGFYRPRYTAKAPVLPLITDQEKKNTKPEATTVAGGAAAVATGLISGNYIIGLAVLGAFTIAAFAFFYLRQKRAKTDIQAMQPQDVVLSRVDAAKQIAAFKSPYPRARVKVVNVRGRHLVRVDVPKAKKPSKPAAKKVAKKGTR